MKRKRAKWRPDLIVALVAVVIGLCTMMVYIFQARVMSRQLHSSVWPYLEVVNSFGTSEIRIEVVNKGVGPAIVKTNRIEIDGTEVEETSIDSLFVVLVGRKLNRTFSTIESRVIAPGERIPFLVIDDLNGISAFDSLVKNHRVGLVLCYCSIYEDCWVREKGELKESNSCKRMH